MATRVTPKLRSLADEIREALQPGSCCLGRADEETEKAKGKDTPRAAKAKAAAHTAEHATDKPATAPGVVPRPTAPDQQLVYSADELASAPRASSTGPAREGGAPKDGAPKEGSGTGLKAIAALGGHRLVASSLQSSSGSKGGVGASMSSAEIFFESLKINKLADILENVEKKVNLSTDFYVRIGQFTFFLLLNFYFVASMVHIPEMEYDKVVFASVRLVDFLLWMFFFCEFLSAYRNRPAFDEVDPSRWKKLAQAAELLQFLMMYSSMQQLGRLKQLGGKIGRELHLAQDQEAMRHKDKTLKRIAAIFTRVFTLLITEIFFIIVGLLALYVNLRGTQAQKLTATSAASWDMHDYLAFLGLANAFGGIVDQEAVGKFSVMTFLFAGEDAIWSVEDETTRWEVESKVLETFMKKFGSKKGLLMFASLTSIDWQQYVLKEDQMSRSRRRGLLHVHNAGSAWAAKIKAKRMIVAPSSNANKVEKKD